MSTQMWGCINMLSKWIYPQAHNLQTTDMQILNILLLTTTSITSQNFYVQQIFMAIAFCAVSPIMCLSYLLVLEREYCH